MNDERPIEKLLRRTAQQRRDAAGLPPELHPANRRLLQAEVASQFPPGATARPSWLAELWAAVPARWVYVGGVFAVLWVLAIALSPLFSSKNPHLAQSAPGAEEFARELAKKSAAAPARSTLPTASDAIPALALSPSGGGNFFTNNYNSPPAAPAAAPVAAGSSRRDERQISRAQEAPEAAALRAEAAIVSGSLPPTIVAESKVKTAGAAATATAKNRADSSSGAARLQASTRSASKEGASNYGAVDLAAPAPVKREEKQLLRDRAPEPQEIDSVRLGSADAVKSFAAPAETEAVIPADTESLARGGGGSGGGGSGAPMLRNSQAYSNIGLQRLAPRQPASPAWRDNPPVLANFKIEQVGRDLRVIDGDGSIYRGVADEENTVYRQMVERQNQKLAVANENQFKFQPPKLQDQRAVPKSQPTAFYRYRVEGTNRTLSQNVVFTWNFIDTNALAGGTWNYNAAAPKLEATTPPAQFPALLQNSFISGRAQFDAGREVEVNAVPVRP